MTSRCLTCRALISRGLRCRPCDVARRADHIVALASGGHVQGERKSSRCAVALKRAARGTAKDAAVAVSLKHHLSELLALTAEPPRRGAEDGGDLADGGAPRRCLGLALRPDHPGAIDCDEVFERLVLIAATRPSGTDGGYYLAKRRAGKVMDAAMAAVNVVYGTQWVVVPETRKAPNLWIFDP